MKRQTAILIFLLAPAAWGQARDPFVDSVDIAVTPMASPVIRLAAVNWDVDLDHDQFVTREEIEFALEEANRNFNRAARHAGYTRRGPAGTNFSAYTGSYGNRGTFGGAGRRINTNSIRMSRAIERRSQVRAAYSEFIASGAEEISLAGPDFRTRFANLDGEQRTLLLKADARGNNDGALSVFEFVDFNDGWLFFKGPFEREFGEPANAAVLDILLTSVGVSSLDEIGLED